MIPVDFENRGCVNCAKLDECIKKFRHNVDNMVNYRLYYIFYCGSDCFEDESDGA